MSTTNRFFIPEPEDIHIGYECDLNMWVEDTPKSFFVNKDNIDSIVKDITLIKVPYLTKEQIESEGWTYKQTNKITNWYEMSIGSWEGDPSGYYGYPVYNMKLLHVPKLNKIKITFSFDAVEDESMFEGECKDKNTLRQICKLLKIN